MKLALWFFFWVVAGVAALPAQGGRQAATDVLAFQGQKEGDGALLGLEESFLFEQEQVVTAPTRDSTKKKASPFVVRVISREEIQKSGASTLPELLRRVVGLEVAELSSSFWSISGRGNLDFASDSLLLLVDGFSQYDEFFGAIRWTTLPLPLESIERVEVVLGPVSALYGSNASRGVISVTTRRMKEDGAEVYGGLGNREQRRFGGQVSQEIGEGWRLNLLGSWEQRDSFDFPASGIPSGQGTKTVLGKLFLGKQFEDPPGGSLSFHLSVLKTPKSSIVIPPGLLLDEGVVEAGFTLDRGPWRFRGKLSHSESAYAIVSPEETRFNEWSLSGERSIPLGEDAKALVGGELRFFDLSSPVILDRDVSDFQGSLFASLQAQPWEEGRLFAAGRLENSPTSDRWHLAPVAGLLQGLGGNWQARLVAGNGYRNPSFVTAYGNFLFPSGTGLVRFKGDPSLRPMRVNSLELGVEGEIGKRVRVRMTGFRNQLRNLIASQALSPSLVQYGNLFSARTTGFEMEVSSLLGSQHRLGVAYGYQHSTGGGRSLTTPNTLKALLTGNPWKDWDYELGLSFLSSRVFHGFGVLSTGPTRMSSSLSLWGGLRYRLPGGKTEVLLSAWNILDQDRPELPGGGAPERRFSILFRHKF